MQTFEERIKKYDADPSLHYYVYFSSASYEYTVDVIQFATVDELKSEYYAKLTYYDTYAEANAAAVEMNKNDTDVKHILGHELLQFTNKMHSIAKQHKNELTDIEITALNLVSDVNTAAFTILEAREAKK